MAKTKAKKAKKEAGPQPAFAQAVATKKGGSYRAEDITVLEGLEAVRRRPGMYIGTTDTAGLHHLVWEVFDNSRDEAMGGFADDIEIALLPPSTGSTGSPQAGSGQGGTRVRVADNGRGIPVDVHSKTKVSALETVMTKLHAGAKFGGEGYKVSGGLHGVGVSVVNALSTTVRAEVHREGGKFMQEYKNGGKPVSKIKKVGSSDLHGTIITFEADPKVFPEREFSWDTIVSHMRQQAYLVRGLRISILDLRKAEKVSDEDVFYLRELGIDAPSTAFYFEGGLRSLVAFQNRHVEPVHKNIFYVEKEQDGVAVEVALQYVDDISSRISAFANNIYNSEGGMHVTGFKGALTRTLNSALKNGNGKEGGETFTGDDVLEGLTAVISVKMREVQFEGQTKSKLGSVEARGAVEAVFSEAFSAFLEENPDDARAIFGKVTLAMKARKAAKAAKESILRKGALEGLALPGKLADCQTKDASESELFVVEGDSAGGCLHGDTKVALVDGREISFKDLVSEHEQRKQNYCYTVDENGSVMVAPILHPRITKHDATVIDVTLDTGEVITCTPDHRFMLRDGSYKEAQFLTQEDSLMPLRRKISEMGGRITIKGYEMVYSPRESYWFFTHVLADKYNIMQGKYVRGEKTVIHHKDFNKRNNNPDNLIRMDHQEHFFFHTTCLEKTLHSPESKEKLRKIRQSPQYREKIRAIMSAPAMRAMLSERAQKQWSDPTYKEYMLNKFLEFYNSNEEYRNRNNKLLNENQREYWAEENNRIAQSKRTASFFSAHPERKEILRDLANEQWNNGQLRKWRSGITKKQWTSEFRAERKKAYNQTYMRKALSVLHSLWLKTGVIDEKAYNRVRKENNDRSLIRLDTIIDRFFHGDAARLKEAVTNYNHRIVSIKSVKQKIDVYDLEVAGTHNFALASGIFIHNSGKMGRDRRTQAVLPLRGKILNIERARLDKMLASEQIKNIIVALGTAIGDVFNIEKLRYHKIIIATDADVDGAHIRTLLLTLFYRHFRPVIDGGFLYIAQPPLYKIKKGKEVAYAYTEEEKVKLVGKETPLEVEGEKPVEGEGEEAASAEATASRGKTPKLSIQRYKGLGEMNPEELWETTMDPARRILKQVTIEDAQEADKIFDMLMGTDVPARKSFIQSHAKEATLDI